MGVCDIPVISTVCDTAGEAAASLISAPFDWLAEALGGAAGWLIETMWSVFDSTTLVDLTGDGYTSVYNLVFGIAVFVVLLFFCFQLILGLIRRDPTALTRAALGTGKAILGSFVVITLTTLALEIVDQLCVGIVQAAGETTETMGDKIALLAAGLAGINISAPGVGAIISIFLAGLMIAAVAIVWFSLLIRKALILIVVILAPLAFSGSAWDVSRSWVGKWAAFLLALIVSKLVLVLVFLIAITQMATPIEADLQAVTEPITGIVMLAIAAFAPYMVYRLIAFLGFDVYNSMGAEQDAKQSVNRPVPMPTKPQGGQPKKVLDGGDGPSGGGGGGGNPPPGGGGGGGGGGSTPPPGGGGGGGGGAAGAGAGGGAAAAGPAAAAVIGAQVVKEAATAGPAAGAGIGGQAEAAADGANQNTTNSDGTTQAPPPSSPAPNAPSGPPPPPPSNSGDPDGRDDSGSGKE